MMARIENSQVKISSLKELKNILRAAKISSDGLKKILYIFLKLSELIFAGGEILFKRV